jgi:hypothetical protein
MSQPAADLDAVVFTDRNGTRVSLGDLFGEPVAVRYEDLIPQLGALMRAPDAPVYHRVLAGELLLREADPDGLAQLIEWASRPRPGALGGPARPAAPQPAPLHGRRRQLRVPRRRARPQLPGGGAAARD